MAFKLADRTRERTGTTGTGAALTLGGLVPGALNQQTFDDGLGVGNSTIYMLLSGDGVGFEEGFGTLTDETHFNRDTVYNNHLGTTDRIDLTGDSRVFSNYPSDALLLLKLLLSPGDKQHIRYDEASGTFVPTLSGYFDFVQVESIGASAIVADNYTASPGDPDYTPGSYGAFQSRFARGTPDAPEYPKSGDLLGAYTFWAWDENLNGWRAGGQFLGQAAADWSDTSRPTRIIISVNGADPAGDQWRASFNPEFTISNAGLTATTNTVSTTTNIIGTTGQNGARFYAEFTYDGPAGDLIFGVTPQTIPPVGEAIGNTTGGVDYGVGLRCFGATAHWRFQDTETDSGMPDPDVGDIIGIGWDLDLGKAWARNVTVDPDIWYGDGVAPDPETGTDGFEFAPFAELVYLGFTSNGNGVTTGVTMNAGATPFEGALPATFLAFDSNVGAQLSIIYWEDGGVSIGGISSMGPGTFNVPGGYYRESQPLITADDVAGNLPVIASGHTLGNSSGGAAAATDVSVTALFDVAFGNTRGSILYRGAAGWVLLTPGTDGFVLTSQGAGADPDWEAGGGGGLPSIASGHIIGNSSGGAATAGDVSLTAIIDVAIGNTRGAILYRGATGWAILAPGTAGNFLKSAGAGADPLYDAVSVSLPTIAAGTLLGNSGASSATAAEVSLTAVIDRAIGNTRGSILYRGSTGWAILAPSATSAYALLSAGTGADPAYGKVRLANRGTWSNGGSYFASDIVNYLGGIYGALADVSGGEQWDASFGDTRFTVTNGGLTANAVTFNQTDTIRSLISKTTGKWYFEITSGTGADLSWGLIAASSNNNNQIWNTGVGLRDNRNWRIGGTESASGIPSVASKTLGFAVDFDNLRIWVRDTAIPANWYGNNGASPNPVTNTNGFDFSARTGTALFIGFTSNQNGNTQSTTLNAGATAFVASAPSGFSAWSTVAPATVPSADTTNWKLLGQDQVGVTDASSAAAGRIGELLTASATAVAIASGSSTSLVSRSLTAGDWEVEAIIKTNPAGTTTTSLLQGGISSTNNTLPAALAGGRVSLPIAAGAGVGVEFPTGRTQINISATTTVYAVANLTYAVSTLTADAFIRARRIR